MIPVNQQLLKQVKVMNVADFYLETVDEDLKPIIPQFLENAKNEVEQMRGALQNNDIQTLRRLGHGAKGAALGYGLQNMAFLGRQIQDLAEKGDLSAVSARINELEVYLSRVKIEFLEMDED